MESLLFCASRRRLQACPGGGQPARSVYNIISLASRPEQSILEIASTAQQHPREPAAAARPSSQAFTYEVSQWVSTRRVPLPRRLWPAGRGRAGKEGPALLLPSSALAAAEVEAWLEGRAAAAGSRGCCCAVLAISRMLCSVAVSADMWQTVSDLRRKRQAWKEVARHPPFSHRPAKSDAGGLEEENLLSGCCSRTPLLLSCIILYSCACACLYMYSLRIMTECALNQRLSSTSPAGRGAERKEGPAPPDLRLRLG